MASFAVTGAAGLFAAAGVALKGAVEVQTHFKYDNNVLARQGEGVITAPSQKDRVEVQKKAGIKGMGESEKEPTFMEKVPAQSPAGDIRGEWKTPAGTSFTNNTATLDDILSSVPKKSYGSSEYKKIARPRPKTTSISNQY